ncbi:TPA: phage tail protein [Streptococcus suis]|nr:phage tail protein [Streptococcus suis]
MIYLFDKDEKLIKIVRKSAVKTALQKYALTTERYVSDRLTVELKGLNADELEQVEYMAIQTMEDAHTFHYFYVAQKFSDSLTTLIGVQSGIEELRKSPVYDKRPKNAFARDVITDLLAGTNWQARFVGETAPHSTNFYYTSVFDALKKVCVVWDLEMQFFVEMNGNRIGARYIDFKQKIGQAVGKRVVYGHNALQILQEVERTNIFTALVGRGKGEETGDGYGRKITFENVVWSTTQGKPVNKPKGRKYLELPLMTRQYGIKNADGSMRPKIGFVDFSEEENPEVLIERTYRALIDAARPQLTLKTSSVYLKGVKVGDTIRVVRHDKKLDYDTRIFEITFNRLNNQSSDIKLGDRIGESNEAKVQTIADKAVEQFVTNEFSSFVQNLPDYLPSADGFNNNWYGAEDPTVKYPGKVLINDIWYKPDPEHEGHKIMLRWTGEVWEEILRTYDSEALRDRIAEEIAQVNQSMQAQAQEHDEQVADILSKTQSVESLANQAKSDAANALSKALQYKNEAIAEATRLDTVERQTTETKLATAKSQAISEATRLVETAKSLLSGQISNVSTDLSQTKEAIKLLATKQTVDALTGRISNAESNLQVQAEQIASRVKISDFDQAKQRLQSAETSINQLGNRITTEIGETRSLIPTEIGSRNLILDFSNRTISTYNNPSNVSRESDVSVAEWDTNNARRLSLTTTSTGTFGYISSGRTAEMGQRYYLPNTAYTGSIYIKNLTATAFKVSINTSKTVSIGPNQTTRVILTDLTSGQRFLQLNFLSDTANVNIDFIYWHPQIEQGTVATASGPAPEDLVTETKFHTLQDTVDAHKRIIGDGSSISQAIQSASKFERSITSGGDIYQAIETAKGLVQQVSGTNGLKTQVSTLAGSYAIKNLTKAGDVLNQINLNKDGSIKIDGSLVQITGKTYIQDGVITSAKIGKGQIGTAHIGEIDAGIAKIINLDVSNIKGLDAAFIKAKIENAFIEWMKGKVITAQNEAMTIGLNDAFIRFKDNAKIEFQSENNTLYRTKNGTSAFIHFRDDSYNGVYTAMGVNADNTGTQNDYSSGSFAGVRVIRSNPSRYSGTTVDQVQLVGDEIRIRHGYGYENDYLVIKWDNQGKIDLIKFLRSVASRLGLPLT